MFRVVSRVSRCGLFSTVIYANLARHGRQTVHIRTVVCVCVFYEICSCCVPTCVRACCGKYQILVFVLIYEIKHLELPAGRRGERGRARFGTPTFVHFIFICRTISALCVCECIFIHKHTHTHSTVLSGAWFENINVNIQNVCQTIVLLRTTTPPPPPPTATSASTGSLFIRYSAQTT